MIPAFLHSLQNVEVQLPIEYEKLESLYTDYELVYSFLLSLKSSFLSHIHYMQAYQIYIDETPRYKQDRSVTQIPFLVFELGRLYVAFDHLKQQITLNQQPQKEIIFKFVRMVEQIETSVARGSTSYIWTCRLLKLIPALSNHFGMNIFYPYLIDRIHTEQNITTTCTMIQGNLTWNCCTGIEFNLEAFLFAHILVSFLFAFFSEFALEMMKYYHDPYRNRTTRGLRKALDWAIIRGLKVAILWSFINFFLYGDRSYVKYYAAFFLLILMIFVVKHFADKFVIKNAESYQVYLIF